jgi:hypothetical protein
MLCHVPRSMRKALCVVGFAVRRGPFAPMGVGLGRCREREGGGGGEGGGERGDVGVCPCYRTSQRRSRSRAPACHRRLSPATWRHAQPSTHALRLHTASRWNIYAARRRAPPNCTAPAPTSRPPHHQLRIGVHPPEHLEPRRRHRRLTSKRIRRLRCSPRVDHSEEPRSGRAMQRTVQVRVHRGLNRPRAGAAVRSARRAHPAIRICEAPIGTRVHVPPGHRRRAGPVQGLRQRPLRARAPEVRVQGLRHGSMPARAPAEPVQGLLPGARTGLVPASALATAFHGHCELEGSTAAP